MRLQVFLEKFDNQTNATTTATAYYNNFSLKDQVKYICFRYTLLTINIIVTM